VRARPPPKYERSALAETLLHAHIEMVAAHNSRSRKARDLSDGVLGKYRLDCDTRKGRRKAALFFAARYSLYAVLFSARAIASNDCARGVGRWVRVTIYLSKP